MTAQVETKALRTLFQLVKMKGNTFTMFMLIGSIQWFLRIHNTVIHKVAIKINYLHHQPIYDGFLSRYACRHFAACLNIPRPHFPASYLNCASLLAFLKTLQYLCMYFSNITYLWQPCKAWCVSETPELKYNTRN